jgi:hypothetical protein
MKRKEIFPKRSCFLNFAPAPNLDAQTEPLKPNPDANPNLETKTRPHKLYIFEAIPAFHLIYGSPLTAAAAPQELEGEGAEGAEEEHLLAPASPAD